MSIRFFKYKYRFQKIPLQFEEEYERWCSGVRKNVLCEELISFCERKVLCVDTCFGDSFFTI